MNNTKNQLNKKMVLWKNKQVWQTLSQTNLKEEKTHKLVKLDIKSDSPADTSEIQMIVKTHFVIYIPMN